MDANITNLKFKRLDVTSYSTYLDQKHCFYRLGLKSYFKPRILSTYISLGNVAHNMLELKNSGFFGVNESSNIPQEFNSQWDLLIQKEYSKLQYESTMPVPNPKKWPNYFKVKTETKHRIIDSFNNQNIVYKKKVELPAKKSKGESVYLNIEGTLEGRIDFVETVESGIRITEYKSGPVLKDDNSGLKDEINEQMAIYAYLIKENLNEWPNEMFVDSYSQGLHEVIIEQKNIEQLIDLVLSLRENYNKQIEFGQLESNVGKDICNICPVKALCKDYLKTAEPDWSEYNKSVNGFIQKVDFGSDAEGLVEINIEGGDHVEGLTSIIKVPIKIAKLIEENIGKSISISSLSANKYNLDLEFKWYTQFWFPETKII